MAKIEAIIFDLDGTLWSAVDNAVEAFRVVKDRHEEVTEDIPREVIEKSMGQSFDDIVKNLLGYIDYEKAVGIAKEIFAELVKNLSVNGGIPYQNLEYTIKSLSRKYKLYIVSNCVKGYIEAFLNTSGLKDCFLDFESNGRTGLSKGENIVLLMQRNNIKSAVYVGDTLSDKIAADYAKIPFIYASYGFGNVEEYDYKLDTISDLTDKIAL